MGRGKAARGGRARAAIGHTHRGATPAGAGCCHLGRPRLGGRAAVVGHAEEGAAAAEAALPRQGRQGSRIGLALAKKIVDAVARKEKKVGGVE